MVRTVSIKSEVERLITQSESPVLLTHDFSTLGSQRQVLRVLRQLAYERIIARIGLGIYARMQYSHYSKRAVLEYSLSTLAREYARRIGATVVPTDAEFDNFRGLSTQVPVGNVVGVDRRINRRLTYGGPSSTGVQLKWVPEGRQRLAELGVDYLYTPLSQLFD